MNAVLDSEQFRGNLQDAKFWAAGDAAFIDRAIRTVNTPFSPGQTPALNPENLEALAVHKAFIEQMDQLQKMSLSGLSPAELAEYLSVKDRSHWQQFTDHTQNLSPSSSIASTMIKALYDTDPNAILSLSPSELNTLGLQLMERVKTHDFATDMMAQINDSMTQNQDNKAAITALVAILSEANQRHMAGDPSAMTTLINQLNASSANPFNRQLSNALNLKSDQFGKLSEDDLKKIIEQAYRDAKLGPDQGPVQALSAQGQEKLKGMGQLDLFALAAAYRIDHDRFKQNPRPPPAPDLALTEDSRRDRAPDLKPEMAPAMAIAMGNMISQLTAAQIETLTSLYALKDEMPPAKVAAEMQKVLQEVNPNLPDDTWRVIANGLREGKALNDVLIDTQEHALPAPLQKIDPPAPTAPEQPDESYRYRNKYAPKPSFKG